MISIKDGKFYNIFILKLAMKLLNYTKINKNTKNLVENKHQYFGPIYSLTLVELETLKMYIKTHLKIEFIYLFQSLANFSILFDKNSGNRFCLCVNYFDRNNLTLKNCYPLSLIKESLDKLERAKMFT